MSGTCRRFADLNGTVMVGNALPYSGNLFERREETQPNEQSLTPEFLGNSELQSTPGFNRSGSERVESLESLFNVAEVPPAATGEFPVF